MREPPCFFLVACEPSGDLLGAHLMRGLKALLNGHVRFAGVGGENMEAEGLKSIFPQSDLALFGLFELLPKIPLVLKRLRETAAAALAIKPQAVITIDGPDFSFRLAKKLKGQGFPLIHYVAPTVWAWRAGRAKKIAKLYDHLLALLPFEPPYFEKEGLACTFVGHPVVEGGASKGSAELCRSALSIPADKKILCVLPGSRRSEIKRLAPIFGETLGLLKDKIEDHAVIVPTIQPVYEYLLTFTKDWPVKPTILIGNQAKFDCFAASHAALAASGTVSLELMMANVPHLIAYYLSPLTVFLYRRLIKVRFANLVNLLQNTEVVPEYLQDNCTPPKLAEAVENIWRDGGARASQQSMFGLTRVMLAPDTPNKAATTVAQVAGVMLP